MIILQMTPGAWKSVQELWFLSILRSLGSALHLRQLEEASRGQKSALDNNSKSAGIISKQLEYCRLIAPDPFSSDIINYKAFYNGVKMHNPINHIDRWSKLKNSIHTFGMSLLKIQKLHLKDACMKQCSKMEKCKFLMNPPLIMLVTVRASSICYCFGQLADTQRC